MGADGSGLKKKAVTGKIGAFCGAKSSVTGMRIGSALEGVGQADEGDGRERVRAPHGAHAVGDLDAEPGVEPGQGSRIRVEVMGLFSAACVSGVRCAGGGPNRICRSPSPLAAAPAAMSVPHAWQVAMLSPYGWITLWMV
jgi:hypothetical protein